MKETLSNIDLMNREKIKEYILAIEENYPPINYTILREALDYCLVMLKEQEEKKDM